MCIEKCHDFKEVLYNNFELIFPLRMMTLFGKIDELQKYRNHNHAVFYVFFCTVYWPIYFM